MLLSALKECNGNRTEASRRLGLHRIALLRKMRKLGLKDHPLFLDDPEDPD
ncbi:MAG: helix-turn-helix domain-containing protein [Nitrospiria bacterium]